MIKWVRSLFGGTSAGNADASIAGLEREAQGLRLELAEREKRAAELEAALARLQSQARAPPSRKPRHFRRL